MNHDIHIYIDTDHQINTNQKERKMDGIMQMGLPVLGIVAAAAVTFYAVSFYEIREVLLISLLIFHFLSSLINLLLLKPSGLCV